MDDQTSHPGSHAVSLYVVACLLAGWCCTTNTSPLLTVHELPDSIITSKCIAAFAEEGSHSAIVYDTSTALVQKVSYRNEYPAFIDTLDEVQKNVFVSRRLDLSYIINDSVVTRCEKIKIVHPSSNWQGQAPWGHLETRRFKRTDINLAPNAR
jgi:hypothetical protein